MLSAQPTRPRPPAGTLRKLFGTDVGENALHGSDSPETAQAEFFVFLCGLRAQSARVIERPGYRAGRGRVMHQPAADPCGSGDVNIRGRRQPEELGPAGPAVRVARQSSATRWPRFGTSSTFCGRPASAREHWRRSSPTSGALRSAAGLGPPDACPGAGPSDFPVDAARAYEPRGFVPDVCHRLGASLGSVAIRDARSRLAFESSPSFERAKSSTACASCSTC